MIRREAGSGGVSPTVYLPLAGGTMVGNVIFNDNISVLLGTGSDGNLYHDGANTYFKNATGRIYIENDASDGDIILKVNDGGVDTTVMTIVGSTGNVGIGTTNPGAKLSVVDGVNTFRFNKGSSNITPNISIDTASGKALALIVGTSGAGFTYDSSGVFNISGDTRANIVGGSSNGGTPVMTFNNGNVGIGTTGPTNLLSLTGQSAKTIWSERNSTAATPGQNLTVRVGGAVAGGTNLGGGSLILAGGTSTGTGTSTVLLQTCPAGSTGTADNALATMLEITGNKFSVFGVTAVVRATALTAADASALNTGDATSDTVIANMRTRIGELESKLTAYGLLT